MLYIIVLIFFISIFMLIYGIMTIINNNKIRVSVRMEQIKDIDKVTEKHDEKKSFSERALMPFYDSLSKILLKVTPKHKLALLKKKLDRAGLLKDNTPEKWLYTRTMFMVIFSTLFGLLAYIVEANILKATLIAIIIMLFISTFFNFYLSKRIYRRKAMIIKALPYTLDLITVSVEAGLSFDGAIARVISNINGELSDEFAKTLKEMRMGIERKIALRNMSERCEVKELSMLVTSLVQADELGVGLGKVLRIESSQLRENRKQAAREQAMKAPIKMLFPLIFFIFPSIFIIILGPAVIKIFDMFLR